MKLPNSAHEAHPWVISRIAPDFRLLDAWAVPIQGRRDEFISYVEIMAALDPADTGSAVVRALFAVRRRVGKWFGWDDATERHPIPGAEETTLGARLPAELRGSADTPAFKAGAAGFTALYRTDDEWAGEISNATVHGVLHLAWVGGGDGVYHGRLAVYVKPRGRLGDVYMRLIEPFRTFIVYPALMRRIGREWNARDVTAPPAL